MDQTLPADEIVLVKDGPLTPELDLEITFFEQILPMKVIELEKNMSLGYALNIGLSHCTHDWVARMDTDDICHKDRFLTQVAFVLNNPEYDLVGSNIVEFIEEPGDLDRKKNVPANHEDIVRFAYSRCPFNHPTVLFRKSAVLAVGSYQSMILFEDYYLWFKLIKAGFKFHNLQEGLLYFRLGKDMLGRRQGWNYGYQEARFFVQAYREGLIPLGALFRFLMRFPIRLLPKTFTLLIYRFLLRK